MANLQTDVPLLNVPFVDDKGQITEAWLLFLIQLWRRTGGSSTGNIVTIDDVLGLESLPIIPIENISRLGMFGEVAAPMISGDSVTAMGEMIFAGALSDGGAQASSTVTATGSPFVYKAGARVALYVSGSLISAISYIRSGVTLSLSTTLLTGGQIFEMNAGDSLSITYADTPTIRVIPR